MCRNMQQLQDRDSKNPLKLSSENLIDPGAMRLTDLEKILIARIHPVMSVYRVKCQ